MIRYLQVVDKLYRLIVLVVSNIIISNELNNKASKKALNK